MQMPKITIRRASILVRESQQKEDENEDEDDRVSLQAASCVYSKPTAPPTGGYYSQIPNNPSPGSLRKHRLPYLRLKTLLVSRQIP